MPTGIVRSSKVTLALALVLAASPAAAEPAWQQSAGPQLELAVRDRNSRGEYSAIFAVTGPGGKEMRLARRVVGDQWSHVLFPRDFGTDLLPGEYSWTGYVDGAAVAGGRFSYAADERASRMSSSW